MLHADIKPSVIAPKKIQTLSEKLKSKRLSRAERDRNL